MSISETRPKRRKRTGDVAREEALIAARKLLLEGGPTAVTLAAIGREIGMSHANLLHHFGSAGELQSALMVRMIQDLVEAIGAGVAHLRSDEAELPRLVDIVFEAFTKGGAGYLAAWIVLSNNTETLAPIRRAVEELIVTIEERVDSQDEITHHRIVSSVLFLAVCAFGDSIIGAPLRGMLGRDDDAFRRLVLRLYPAFLDPSLFL
jgi:TetR/AcrR family transcriptional regulator, repressor for neighboring sulfatase